MAWIESHQELGRHPKVKRLARKLNVGLPQAVGHLHFLWWWALDYADNGDLSNYDEDDIAEAAEWNGDAFLFTSTLIEVGFIDRREAPGNGYVLHDWHDYAGKLLARREVNAKRMKRTRATNVPRTQRAHADHETRMCGATVPNRTVPNRTVPTTTTEADEEANVCAEKFEEPKPDPTDAQIGQLMFTVYGASGTAAIEIDEYIAMTSKVVVLEALTETIANATKSRIPYFRKIMTNWLPHHPKTKEDIDRIRAAFTIPSGKDGPRTIDDVLAQLKAGKEAHHAG